jgi:hypothetical protein
MSWAVTFLAALFLSACGTAGPRGRDVPTQTPAPVAERVSQSAPPDVVPGGVPATTLPAAPVVESSPPSVPAVQPGPPASTADLRTLTLRLLPPGMADRAGWATDIGRAFTALRLPADAEHLCAAMAVIEQESSWQADPVVPGLPRIVWREIEKRRARYGIPKLLLDTALLKRSPDGRSYRARIDSLRTEREMSALYDAMISELPYGRQLLAGSNPVRTGGPMQVSVEFAEQQMHARPYPYPRAGSVRNEVFSRRGGIYFGIANLLDYPADYSSMLYRYADFNAGRYSSRNAAFQAAVARLGGRKLAPDGDLLRYADGHPSGKQSQTQAALYALARRLGLGRAAIDRDLAGEKQADFSTTALYRRVFALADQAARSPVPRERVPAIELKSPKIQRKLTTEWFARRVLWRQQACQKRAAA